MCNYELLAIEEGVGDRDVLAQIEHAVAALKPMETYDYIFLTSQGSFFDNHEVSYNLRLQIADRLRAAGVRAQSTESEAKFCRNLSMIEEYQRRLGAPLSIGIGFEAADPYVRNVIINKGLSDETFAAAAHGLQETGIGFYTYITIGKPFLSIQEDIEDAKKAVKYSADMGAFMSVLEAINIQPHTLTATLHSQGLYRPPSIWTGIAILRELPGDLRARVSLKGIEGDIQPVPLALSVGCDSCTHALRSAIREWNFNRKFDCLEQVWGKCECFSEWERQREKKSTETIHDRVLNGYARLEMLLGLEHLGTTINPPDFPLSILSKRN